jgi:hypothetical protein
MFVDNFRFEINLGTKLRFSCGYITTVKLYIKSPLDSEHVTNRIVEVTAKLQPFRSTKDTRV